MLSLTRSTAAMLLSAVASGLFLVSSPSAMAASDDWYSRSAPLTARDDGVAQGYAYGTAYTKNTYLKNHTYYRDARAGGQKVYTETTYSYKVWCNTEVTWCGERGKDQSARSGSAQWVDQYDSNDYSDRNTDAGRVHYKVCEDQNNSPDACSRKPYSVFNGL